MVQSLMEVLVNPPPLIIDRIRVDVQFVQGDRIQPDRGVDENGVVVTDGFTDTWVFQTLIKSGIANPEYSHVVPRRAMAVWNSEASNYNGGTGQTITLSNPTIDIKAVVRGSHVKVCDL